MDLREDIKILMIKENVTLVDLARLMSDYLGEKITADSLSKKIRNGTMKYNEAMKIFNLLGYGIEFKRLKY